MDKEKRRQQSIEMKQAHRTRNLIGIAMLSFGRWRGTLFINGVAHQKNKGTIFKCKTKPYFK